MRRHRLTFDEVADAVRRSSVDLPGGSVRTERGEILLRTIGQAYRGADYERLMLWTREDGSRLLLGDVANVVDGFAETDQRARFDEAPAVMVSVYRSGEQSVLDVAAAVRDYVEQADAWLPEGITLTVWQDQSLVLSDRLAIMLGNGAAGFLLVFVVLTLFLEMRLAFWVSLGIPISFLGALAVMPALDVSVNMASCFAFILVLGIVVDDAIIVGENVHRHQERGGDGLGGAVRGAQEIGKPVVYAVLTTAAAFVPLMLVESAFGQMFRVVPLVAVPCLLFSLLESLGILPAHLAHRRRPRRAGPWRRLQQRIAGGLVWFVREAYEPFLDVALRWRYVSAAVGAVHPGAHRRRRPRRLDRLPVRPVHRERVHDRVDHDAAGHPGGSDLGRGRDVRGGSCPAARPAGGRDRCGPLPARGDDDRRSAGAGERRGARGTDKRRRRGRRQHRRGDHRARARGDPLLHQRAARHPVARGDRAGAGGGRHRLPHLAAQRRRRRRRRALRARPRPPAGRRRPAPGRVGHLRRGLRDRRHRPHRQVGDAARHPPRGGGARAEAGGLGATGAAGVLRRGGPAHPAGAGRRPGHGALPARAAAVAGRPGGHAHPPARRGGGALPPGGPGRARPRLRLDPAHRPQPCRERDRVGRPAGRLHRGPRRRPAQPHPARGAGRVPRRVLRVQGHPGGAGGSGGRPAGGAAAGG